MPEHGAAVVADVSCSGLVVARSGVGVRSTAPGVALGDSGVCHGSEAARVFAEDASRAVPDPVAHIDDATVPMGDVEVAVEELLFRVGVNAVGDGREPRLIVALVPSHWDAGRMGILRRAWAPLAEVVEVRPSAREIVRAMPGATTRWTLVVELAATSMTVSVLVRDAATPGRGEAPARRVVVERIPDGGFLRVRRAAASAAETSTVLEELWLRVVGVGDRVGVAADDIEVLVRGPVPAVGAMVEHLRRHRVVAYPVDREGVVAAVLEEVDPGGEDGDTGGEDGDAGGEDGDAAPDGSRGKRGAGPLRGVVPTAVIAVPLVLLLAAALLGVRWGMGATRAAESASTPEAAQTASPARSGDPEPGPSPGPASSDGRGSDGDPTPTRVVGHPVRVEVPERWVVIREEPRAGTRRQVVAEPGAPDAAILVDSRVLTPGTDTAGIAEGLREVASARRARDGGAGVELFEPNVEVGGVEVIRYTERTGGGGVVRWHVRVIGRVQVGVGCRGAGHGGDGEDVCERAVRTAALAES